MAITVVCNGCGKQYRVADQAAGKKLRCRECGQDMLVPRGASSGSRPAPAGPGGGGEEDPFEALVAMERSAAPAAPTGRSAKRPQAFAPAEPIDVDEGPARAKPKRRRPPGRFGRRPGGGAGTDNITPWLVIAFIVAQLAAAVLQTVQAGHVEPSAHGKVVGVVWIAAIVHIVLLFAVLGPAVWLGVFISSMILNFRIVDLGYLRGCAIATLPALLLLLSTFVPPAMAGTVGMATVLSVALLLLIPVTFLTLRFVFDLDWVGSAVAYLFSGPLYVGAAVLASNVLMAAVLAQLFGGANAPPTHFFDREEFARVPKQDTTPAPAAPQPTDGPSTGGSQADIEAKKTQTQENLRQIGQAAQRFAAGGSTNALPATLGELVSAGGLAAECLNSPFQPSKTGGYFYWPGRSPAMPGTVAIAYDAAELSSQGGAHVLFADGNVEWRDAGQFNALTAQSDQAAIDWQAEQQREAERRRQAQIAMQSAAPANPATHPVEAPPVPRPTDFVARFNADKSAAVASVTAAPIEGDPREIVAPVMPSPWAAVVRSAGDAQDQVELWDLIAAQKKGDASFTHEAGFQTGYAINPSGTLLARTATFPKLGVRIWSFKEQRETRTIPLNETLGTPTLAGFIDAERLVIRWTRGSDEGLEVWNAITGMRARQVPLQPYQRGPNNGVFSPDGRAYGLTTAKIPLTRANQQGPVAHVEFYDLFNAANWRRWREVTEISAADVDTPAGMAFSPDGKKLAAVFVRQGSGFIDVWRVGDTKSIGGYEVAVAPGAGASPDAGPGLVWVHNGNEMLVLGNTLVDANSGKTIGQLNAPPSAGQRVLAGDTLAFTYDENGKSRIAIVRLEGAKASGATTTPAEAAKH